MCALRLASSSVIDGVAWVAYPQVMSSKLHVALERLDSQIDGLEAAMDEFLAQKATVSAPASEDAANDDRAEVLGKLDGIIGKLETILKA
jgi:hypothetical protein